MPGAVEVGQEGEYAVGAMGGVAGDAGEARAFTGKRMAIQDDARAAELLAGGELEVELRLKEADPRVGIIGADENGVVVSQVVDVDVARSG